MKTKLTSIKVGDVVKYRELDDSLTGGTVVELVVENNEEYALINTIEGLRIFKKESELCVIGHQQHGRVKKNLTERDDN